MCYTVRTNNVIYKGTFMINISTPSVWKIVKNSFEILWNNKSVALVYIVLTALLNSVMKFLIPNFTDGSPTTTQILLIICVIPIAYIMAALYLGATRLALALIRKNDETSAPLFSCIAQPLLMARFMGAVCLCFFSVMGVALLLALPAALLLHFTNGIPEVKEVATIATLLQTLPPHAIGALVIAGLFFFVALLSIGLRLMFYSFFIVDQDATIVESLKMSVRITKNNLLTTIKTFILVSICTTALSFVVLAPLLKILAFPTQSPFIIVLVVLLNALNILISIIAFAQLYLIFGAQKSANYRA